MSSGWGLWEMCAIAKSNRLQRVKAHAICILSACTVPHCFNTYCSMFSSFCRFFFFLPLEEDIVICDLQEVKSFFFFLLFDPFLFVKIGDFCLSAEFLLLTLCLPRSPICTSVKLPRSPICTVIHTPIVHSYCSMKRFPLFLVRTVRMHY